jgi:hypothetical protein
MMLLLFHLPVTLKILCIKLMLDLNDFSLTCQFFLFFLKSKVICRIMQQGTCMHTTSPHALTCPFTYYVSYTMPCPAATMELALHKLVTLIGDVFTMTCNVISPHRLAELSGALYPEPVLMINPS